MFSGGPVQSGSRRLSSDRPVVDQTRGVLLPAETTAHADFKLVGMLLANQFIFHLTVCRLYIIFAKFLPALQL